MSSRDYISKSALIMSLRDYQFRNFSTVEFAKEYNLINEIIEGIEIQPTLSETEIIRKAFERVVERLEEKQTEYEKISEQKYFDMLQACYYKGYEEGYKGAIEIVKEECGISE